MAMTMDGFLPREDEELMKWVKTDQRYGFPYWLEKATMPLFPHYPLSRLFNKEKEDAVLLAEVIDKETSELLRGLFFYNLVDEIVLYLLPLSYREGSPLSGNFQPCQWTLRKVKSFPNGICRMVFHR